MKNKKIYCFIFFSIIFVLFLSFFPTSKANAQSFYLEAIPECFNSKTRVTLSWEEAGTNPVYYIERKVSGGAYSDIGSTNLLSYVDEAGILSDKDYYYKIRAVGGGTFYSEERLVPAQYCAPSIYGIDSSCQTDGPRITFSWHAVSGDFLRYEIFRKKEGEPQFSYLTQTSLTSFSDGPEIEGTKNYSYAVKAIWQYNASSTGVSPWQVTDVCPVNLSLSANCLSSSPGGPENFLSWNALMGVQKYEIWRKPINGSDYIKIFELSGNSHSDKLVETLPNNYYLPGTNYYYIKAVWPGGYNSTSSINQQNSLNCSPFLEIQDNCDEKSMRLFWTRALGTTLSINYRIIRNGSFLAQAELGNNNYVDSVLPQPGCGNPPSCNVTYRIEVVEYGGMNSGDVSKNINCVNPPVPSPAPVLKNPTTECKSSGGPLKSVVRNEWSPSQYVFYYKLFRDGVIVTPGPGYEVSYEDTGVEGGQNYTYYVNAFNSAGEVSSNQVNIQSASCYLPSPIPELSLDSSCSNDGFPEINLFWTASEHIVNYTIYKGPTEFNLTELETVEPNILSYKDVSVATSTKYHYKIRANGFEGVGFSDSATLEITSSHCLPTVPSLWLTNDCNGWQPVINVNWSTDELHTVRYEIFRNNALAKEINSPSIKTWQDTVNSKTSYQYRVEAIGPLGQRSKSSNVNIVSWFCRPPDDFHLNDASVSCKNSYPWSTLSWENNPNAVRYDLNRYLYSGNTVISTTTFKAGTSTSFIDRGSGYALKFDGGTGLVEIGSSDDFDNLTKFSLEFWIKPEIKGFASVLSTCNSYSCDQGGYNFYLRNEINQDFQFTLTNTNWRNYNYEPGNWYHVVSTYDGQYMKLYVNNQYIGRYTKASTTFTYPIKISASSLTIGGGIPSVGNFRGLIDEVRVYANVMPEVLVQAHYSGNYSGDYNGCGNSGGQNCEIRGLWHFDEGSGIVVTDSSNRNNDGTIKGSPLPTWVLNGPQIETKYSWQAIAYSNGPDPTFSNITPSVITLSCPPAQPGIFLAPSCSPNSSIMVDWSYSINANEYQIWRSIENDPAVKIKEFIPPPSPDSLQWQDSGLTTGTNYTYFVRAVGSGGFTDSASSSMAAPYCNVPDPVENVNAVSLCSGSFPRITLTWSPSAHANWYEIFRNGDFYKSTPDTHIFDDYPNVKVEKKYSYSVVPHNTAGAGAPSSEASTTAIYCPVSKSSFSISTYCSSTNPVVEMNFTDSTFFNSKEYNIWRSGSGSPISTILATDTSALKFTTNPITDYIRCGQDPSLNITEKLTIELWVKPGSVSQEQSFIAKGRDLTTNNYQLGTGSSGRRLRFRWGVTGGGSYINSSLHNFSTGVWYHVVVTVDTVNDILIFYKNGVPLSSHAFTGSLTTNSDPLFIGYGNDSVFKGSMDEVRIYNRVLGSNEILDHYNKNYSNHEINIRGLWHFNEGSGRVSRDSSGYANDCDIRPVDQYGVYWENLSESDPTYPLIDTRFSNEYKYFQDNQNLESNTNYSYWVETIGNTGPATSADSKSITTLNCNTIPSPPTNLNLNSGCVAHRDPFNYLSWSPSSNAFSYNIYRSTTSGPISTFYNYNSPFFDRRSFVLDFDGTATTNIRIKDPIYGSRVLDGLTAVSIEFWIYFDPGASSERNILKDDGMVFHGFRASTFHLSGPGGGSGYLGYNRSLPSGTWHHFVGTWDRSQEGNNMKLYLNGELQSEQRFDTANYLYYGSSDLLINDGWQGNIYPPINGKLDELRVYSRALRAEEVTEHFNGIYKDESGLKGLWHFDEGGSFPAPDESGYGNHGTVYGSVPVNGQIGNAFRFNTSTDYINCGNPDILNATSAITIQAWVYPTSWQGYPRIVSKESGNSAYPYALEYISNSIRLYINKGSGEVVAAQSSGAPPLNQWTHVAATWDGTTGEGRIYFNGAPSGSPGNQPGIMASNLNNFLIGNSPTGERPWKGYLDEIRIYNRALEGGEISTCFSDPDNCSDVDLIGFWPLDKGLSSTLIDSSGNNNHGYIVKSGVDWLWATSGNAFYNSKIHRSAIQESKSYDYLVTACGRGTESNFSNLKNITSSLCQPYIKDFSIVPDCYDGPSGQKEPIFYLTWDSNGESFTVMRKRTTEGIFQSIGTITNNEFSDVTMENTPGIEYQYYIIVHDSLYGENVYSEVKNAVVPQCITALLDPVITEVFPYCPGSGPGAWPRIRVSWGPPLNPLAVGYEIWRRADNCDEGPSWEKKGESYGIMSFIDSDNSIENNKYYCYKVRAFDAENNFSNFSIVSGVLTGDCVNSPPTPFPVVSLDSLSYPWRAGNLWLQISWEDVSAEDGYKIFRKPWNENWGDRTDPGNPWLIFNEPQHSDPGDIFYQDFYPDFLDAASYDYSVVAWNGVAHVPSDDLRVNLKIALPGVFNITGNDSGSNITINLMSEPATTAAAGRASYTFYRGGDLAYQEALSTGIISTEPGKWATFSDECIATTSLSCVDQAPNRDERYYVVTARAANADQDPDYTPSNLLDLFIFAPKWKEIPLY